MTFEQTADSKTQTAEPTQTTAPAVETSQVPSTQTTNPTAETTAQDQPKSEQVATDLPKSHEAYKVEIDGFDFDAFKADNGEVLKDFHAQGMTNKQVESVVKAFDQHMQVNMEALQQEWGNDYQQNVNLASQAIKALGLTPEQIDSPTGVLRLAAAIGKHIQEDFPPQNTQQSGSESITQLMMSEAYSNPSHPDHKSVTQRVDAYYAKNYTD